MLSMMGDNIEHVISYWMMWQAFHSPWLGGFAVISHWLPHLLFSVHVGNLADRIDCRKLILAGQTLFFAVSLVWGVLFLTGTLQVWHAIVLLCGHGLAGVSWNLASQMIIHDIVGREHLQSAVRMNSTARQLGLVLGPAVGGTLLVTVGGAYGMLINTLFYLPMTIWLLRVPYTGHLNDTAPRRPSVGFGQLIGAVRELSGNRAILSIVAVAGVSSLLVGNAYVPQMPQFAEELGTDRSGLAYTALLAANAVGAVLGGLILEGGNFLRPRVRTAVIAAIIWCGSLVGFAFTTSYAVALSMLFVAGVSMLTFNSMAQTLVQLEAPPELRGRAVGLFGMASSGLRVGSGFSVGFVGTWIGIHWSLGLSSAILLAAILVLAALLLRPSQRRSLVA
jgi:MFS family permease